jgi:hypothetical protein
MKDISEVVHILLRRVIEAVAHLKGHGISAKGTPRVGDFLLEAQAMYQLLDSEDLTEFRKQYPHANFCASYAKITMEEYPLLLEELEKHLIR